MEIKTLLLSELKEYNSLYRFTSLDAFLNCLLTKSLTLVNPDMWDDPHEMLFIKDIVDKSIEGICGRYDTAINDYLAVKDWLKIQYMIDNLYAQCWSTCSESDALWRIYYNEGKTLRLCVKLEQIQNHNELIASKVTYNDIVEECNCLDEYNFYKLVTLKRFAFEHEQEVRVIFCPKIDEDDLYARFLQLYQSDFLRRKSYCIDDPEEEKELHHPNFLKNSDCTIGDEIMMYRKTFGKIQNVAIEPSEFIDSVSVSPFAPAWFCQMINTLCETYGIKYAGQSKLYEKKTKDFALG